MLLLTLDNILHNFKVACNFPFIIQSNLPTKMSSLGGRIRPRAGGTP